VFLGALLTDPVQERLAYIWTKRSLAESEATARFAAYADRMKALGAPSTFEEETRRASADEKRHLELCLGMTRRFGVDELALPRKDFSPLGPDSAEQLFSDVVATCCFSETINVALLSTTLQFAKDPEIREVTRELLSDEVRHSRLGWAYLAWGRAQGLGASLAEGLPRMLATVSGPDLFADEPARENDASYRFLGDARMSERLQLFYTTVEQVILRGLQEQGIALGRAREWLAAPNWPAGVHEE
jgi:hypothetical protein